jgi:Domain of unknown function (DUF4142)
VEKVREVGREVMRQVSETETLGSWPLRADRRVVYQTIQLRGLRSSINGGWAPHIYITAHWNFETNRGLPRLIEEETVKKIAILVAACALTATSALAESTGEKTGINSALGITPKTADFITEAAQSDMFEIASSNLATSKTQDEVQVFADRMVADHTKTTNELKPLAQRG